MLQNDLSRWMDGMWIQNIHHGGYIRIQKEMGRRRRKEKKKKKNDKKRKNRRVVDWLELEKDTLELILRRLTVLVDIIRFGAVCKRWRSIFLEKHHHPHHQLPVLIIPGDDDKNNEFRSFFSFSDKQTYRLKKLPDENNERCCCGSSEGYLILIDLDLNIFLLNPFSRTETPLPRLTTVSKFIDFHETDTGKIEYSSRFPLPDHPNLIKICNYMGQKHVHKAIKGGPYVIAILASRGVMAFCRLDGDAWTYMEIEFPWEDLVCYNGNFYVISYHGRVGVVDVSGPHPTLTMVAMIVVERELQDCSKYLVESSGQLLMVARENDIGSYEYHSIGTTDLKIFMVDVNKHMCFPLKDLGDGMLFLGENSLVSLSAQDFSRCKRNRIYFIDDESWAKDYCIRVYNVEDGSFERYYKMDRKWKCPHPIWLTPKLW